jgi:hypothetical protein
MVGGTEQLYRSWVRQITIPKIHKIITADTNVFMGAVSQILAGLESPANKNGPASAGPLET